MFESLTKRSVDEPTLAAMVRAAFGGGVGLAAARELNEGFFNAAFRLTLTDGRDVVVKASPTPDVRLLTYERDIMRGEAEFFREAARSAAPLPRVLHTGFDRTLIDGDFLIMSAVEGATWHSVEQRLDPRATRAVKRRLGDAAAHLHTVVNPAGRFGYPAVPELSGPTWPQAFAAMMDAMLDDAVRFAATLPMAAEDLRDLVARNLDALEAIGTPVLVHFDLWPGNVMVAGPEEPGQDPAISALIDGERMIWGDPLLEFIGMDVFGRADLDEDITAGYTAAGGTIDRGGDADRRLALYYLYMHVLLLTEMGPRGYTDPQYLDHFNLECPKRILDMAGRLN